MEVGCEGGTGTAVGGEGDTRRPSFLTCVPRRVTPHPHWAPLWDEVQALAPEELTSVCVCVFVCVHAHVYLCVHTSLIMLCEHSVNRLWVCEKQVCSRTGSPLGSTGEPGSCLPFEARHGTLGDQSLEDLTLKALFWKWGNSLERADICFRALVIWLLLPPRVRVALILKGQAQGPSLHVQQKDFIRFLCSKGACGAP